MSNHVLRTNSAAIIAIMLLLGGGYWLVRNELLAEPLDGESDVLSVEPIDWKTSVEGVQTSVGRRLTDEEREAVLDRLVEDEVLFAEGLTRNPWQWDPVVRRRLVELVRFFDTDDFTESSSEAERRFNALQTRSENYEILVDGEPLKIEGSTPGGDE